MIDQIWQNKSGPLVVEPFYRQARLPYALSGSQRHFSRTDYGQIVLQQFAGLDFSISYITLDSFKNSTHSFHVTSGGFHFLTPVKSDIKIVAAGCKKTLTPGFYSLTEMQDNYFETYTKKRQQYRFFYIRLGKPLIQNFAPSTAARLLSHHEPMGPIASDIVGALLNASFEENILWLFYEMKIKELLFEIVAGNRIADHPTGRLTSFEIQTIQSLDSKMRYNPEVADTMLDTSAKTGISQYKLKLGFKELFGTGIFERLLHWRIEMACKQLKETNKPIKEIAATAGYKRISSFITMFRKKTGQTPGEYRMQQSGDPSTN